MRARPASRHELRPLLADVREALRSELGARAAYPLLARCTRDEALRGVLRSLAAEEREQVTRVQALLVELGDQARGFSLRRTAMAWGLFLALPLVGLRFALRLCHDAEARVARWYMAQATWSTEMGLPGPAEELAALSLVKSRHAATLSAFVENAPARWRG